MSNEFKNRVYGCVVVKAINANYNADFSGMPRRLKSDGTFYATDKAFKWLVRNYIQKNYPNKKILFTKKFDENIDTLDLKKAFEITTDTEDLKELKKKDILPKLTECIDVRLFGAVFSPENAKKDSKDENKNISIHGPVQINHAIDLYKKGKVYTDEILAPFTAIGSMSKATEAHYIHHFSINPKNLLAWKEIVKDENIKVLSENDINILKNAFNNAATYYDSHSKSGIENELSIYVTLKEDSMITLPNFSQFITFSKIENKNIFDISKLLQYLSKYKGEIDSIDIYYIKELVEITYDMNIFCENGENSIENKIKKHDLLELVKVEENGKTN